MTGICLTLLSLDENSILSPPVLVQLLAYRISQWNSNICHIMEIMPLFLFSSFSQSMRQPPTILTALPLFFPSVKRNLSLLQRYYDIHSIYSFQCALLLFYQTPAGSASHKRILCDANKKEPLFPAFPLGCSSRIPCCFLSFTHFGQFLNG